MAALRRIALTNRVEDGDGLAYDVFARDWADFLEESARFPVRATGFVNRWDGRHEAFPFCASSVADVVRILLEGRDDVEFDLGWERRNGRLKLVWDHRDASGSTLIIDHPDGSAVTESDLFGQKGNN